MRTLIMALSLMLSACATHWSRPGATQNDLASDQATCDYEAMKATAAVDNAVAAGMREGMITSACMRSKGWTR